MILTFIQSPLWQLAARLRLAQVVRLALLVAPLLLIVACGPAASEAKSPLSGAALPAAPAMPDGFSAGPSDLQAACEYWLAPAPAGDDDNPGTFEEPWASLEYAGETLPDQGCTVWVNDGLYVGRNTFHRRFERPATFKAVNRYQAVFEDNGSPLVIRGARNIIFEGFEFRHDGPEASLYLIQVSRKDDNWSEEIIFRDNIFHDSHDNDLMKIHNGSRYIIVQGNVFYNQGSSEQHMDVNSVTDVIIQDNIFFNDFAGSDRIAPGDTKHFIMIKDSNEGDDGLLGSERVTVRRNIFLNWQGGNETMIKTGNDGKPYHEAKDVLVENNLLIGNSPELIGAAFGVRGARDVTFANNTVVGDLPSKAYAFRVSTSELNPDNENIYFLNNIFSDPSGTMGAEAPAEATDFSDGDPANTVNLVLDNNLYWNGGQPIPDGNLASPTEDDAHRLVADPLLLEDQDDVQLPRWTGDAFLSGNTTIRQEFERLVDLYGRLPAHSPAIGAGDPDYAPADDILGRTRSTTPAVGAYEGQLQLSGHGELTTINLWWSTPAVPGAVEYAIHYRPQGGQESTINVPLATVEHQLTGLLSYTLYDVRLDVLNGLGQILARSNQLRLLTTDLHNFLPLIFSAAY